MDATFIQARIDATKLLIVAYENAVLALGNSGVQSYMLDTGQTKQNVTKFDIEWINDLIDGLYNRCVTLEARLNGSGTTTVRPCF